MNSTLLVYQAKSFYNAYIALEQLSREDSDALLLLLAPLIVNGAFSIELTLKAILAKNQISYKNEHSITSQIISGRTLDALNRKNAGI